MEDFESQLTAFTAQFETLNSKGEDAEDGYNREFMSLKAESQQYREQNTFPADSGQLPQNKKKNRFKDILPFEYTRVQLHKIEGVEGSDYINANYVQGADGNVTYIAAQGPLPQTVNDFWRMIWYHQIEIIIMACREVENGKAKCQCYWPPAEESQYFGAIKVTMHHEENISDDFIVRELMAECQGEEQMVRQYHYSAWPDHGRPQSSLPIIRMLEMVMDHRKRHDIPVVVHCSAGCGRTGTIIAIDYARTMLLNKDLSAGFNVYNIVHEMRKQRPAMVQAKDQYVFVYLAIMELIRRIVEKVPQAPPKLMNFEKKPSPPTPKTTPSNTPIYSNIQYEAEGSRDEAVNSSPPMPPKPAPRTARVTSDSELVTKPPSPPAKPKKPARPEPATRKTSSDPVPAPRKSPVPPPEVPTYTNVPQEHSTPVPKERKPNTSSSTLDTSTGHSTSSRSIVEILMEEVGDVLPPTDFKEVSSSMPDSSYALLSTVEASDIPPDIPVRTLESTQFLVTEVPSAPVYETPDKELIKVDTPTKGQELQPPVAASRRGKSRKKDKPDSVKGTSPVKNIVNEPKTDSIRFPGEMGFGIRVSKPRGPRNIPSHWSVPNGLTLHY